ncbi:MAG: hypothetical protein ACI9ES_003028 [Oceanospirillaceae bacterium]|jgi:hypothetical protein
MLCTKQMLLPIHFLLSEQRELIYTFISGDVTKHRFNCTHCLLHSRRSAPQLFIDCACMLVEIISHLIARPKLALADVDFSWITRNTNAVNTGT